MIAIVVGICFFMLGLGLFALATIFYVRARIHQELAEASELAAHETTRILQEHALAAQKEAREQIALAREFILEPEPDYWEGPS